MLEAILDDPFPVLMAQANKAKGEAVATMKADGIEYEERMELLEEVTYPKPLEEGLRQAFDSYRATHPWVRESDLSPKSVVRDMYEQGRSFTEFIGYYGLSRSEGLVLRYLSDAYRALRRTVPESMKTDELDEIIEWLGETVRQTDSSLLDEWEALSDPDLAQRVVDGEPQPPARPITGNERAFIRMIRNALFQRVRLAADDRSDVLGELDAANAALTDPPGRPAMSASACARRTRRLLGRVRVDRQRTSGTLAGAVDDRSRRRPRRLAPSPDHQGPRRQPRLRDHCHRQPRRLRRDRRAGHTRRILRRGITARPHTTS